MYPVFNDPKLAASREANHLLLQLAYNFHEAANIIFNAAEQIPVNVSAADLKMFQTFYDALYISNTIFNSDVQDDLVKNSMMFLRRFLDENEHRLARFKPHNTNLKSNE